MDEVTGYVQNSRSNKVITRETLNIKTEIPNNYSVSFSSV